MIQRFFVLFAIWLAALGLNPAALLAQTPAANAPAGRLAPQSAIGGGLVLAGEQTSQGLLLDVEIAASLFEPGVDLVRAQEAPTG